MKKSLTFARWNWLSCPRKNFLYLPPQKIIFLTKGKLIKLMKRNDNTKRCKALLKIVDRVSEEYLKPGIL